MAIHQEKPSRNEDEYFAKQDAELLKAKRSELDEERARRERAAHFMKCPRCGGTLKERQHHHVKIDVCADCKGTWLDAGELEMITKVDRNNFSRFIGDLLGIDHK